jgi:hypothetical protein
MAEAKLLLEPNERQVAVSSHIGLSSDEAANRILL